MYVQTITIKHEVHKIFFVVFSGLLSVEFGVNIPSVQLAVADIDVEVSATVEHFIWTASELLEDVTISSFGVHKGEFHK